MATEQQSVQPASSGPLAVETDERTARAGWRSSIVGALIVTLIAGIWLALSAAILDYSEPSAPVILGVLIAILALLRLFGPTSSRTLALTTAGAGALTALTAFLFQDAPGETANQALIGLAVVLLSLIGLAANAERSRSSRP